MKPGEDREEHGLSLRALLVHDTSLPLEVRRALVEEPPETAVRTLVERFGLSCADACQLVR